MNVPLTTTAVRMSGRGKKRSGWVWRFINLRTFSFSLVWKLNSGFIKPQDQDVGSEPTEVPVRPRVCALLPRYCHPAYTKEKIIKETEAGFALKADIKGQREAI